MSKAITFLYAIVSYIAFFGTFLYLIAFVGDLPFVPRTVDHGTEEPLVSALLINAALIALFGLQHSIMARQGFKKAWTRVVPPQAERSTFVLFASLALITIFLFWRPVEVVVWSVQAPMARALLWAVFAVGWLTVLVSTFLINHFELFGLQQAYLHARGRKPPSPVMREPFLYRFVRHPLYVGFFLAFWATPKMTAGHLLFASGMSAYIILAISFEERDLLALFGRDYEEYCGRVGKLVPRLGRGN